MRDPIAGRTVVRTNAETPVKSARLSVDCALVARRLGRDTACNLVSPGLRPATGERGSASRFQSAGP